MTKPITASLTARLGAALVAALIAFGLCELAARAVFPSPPNSAREPQMAYLQDADLRFVPMPSQKGWVDDGLVTINAHGFRGPEIAPAKPEGRFRIVTIGDSVTFGWGVDDEDTFPAQLEGMLRDRAPGRDLDVVNAAVAGYNTRQAVARLARDESLLDPDLVILGFYSNDVPDALDDVAGRAPSGTRIEGTAQPGRVMHINPSGGSWLIRRSRAIYVGGRALKRLTGSGEWATSRFALEMDLLNGRTSQEIEEGWTRVDEQLHELAAVAERRDFAVAVIVLPCREHVLGQFTDVQYQSRLRRVAEPLGFQVIDPLPTLRTAANRSELFIPYDRNHPSALGHRMIASAIANELASGILTTD